MFGVFGSGFGLYGYLPGLVSAGADRIMLPERYRSRLHARTELASFASRIHWVASEDAILEQASGLAIARRPEDQADLVHRLVTRPNIVAALLEKPLAPSPTTAAAVLEEMLASRKTFRIGYLLAHTSWAPALERLCGQPSPIQLTWHFHAHHLKHHLANWKRFDSQGGGALRFYGIHLIAVLARMRYTTVEESHLRQARTNETYGWDASFSGPRLPRFDLSIAIDEHDSAFRIAIPDRTIVDLTDPFGAETSKISGLDPRVQPVARIVRSLEHGSHDFYTWYDSTIALWQAVEERNNIAKA